jgi:hypothetical protein
VLDFFSGTCNTESVKSYIKHFSSDAVKEKRIQEASLIAVRTAAEAAAAAAAAAAVTAKPVAPYVEGACSPQCKKPSDYFKCSECTYTTQRSDHYSDHVKSHKNMTSHECDQCKFACVRKCDLKRHQNTVHTKTEIYKCTECSYSTPDRSNLATHSKTQHQCVKFKCCQCPYTGQNEHTFNIHTQRHMQNKLYACDQCSFVSVRKYNLKRHQITMHTKTEIYQCVE